MRERIEAEATRIEADREAAEAQRRADEAKRLEDERVKAVAKLAETKLAEAKLAEEHQRVAAVEAEKNTTRQIEITPEPIPPAGDAASQKFPAENNSPETDEDLKESAPTPPPVRVISGQRPTLWLAAQPSSAGFGGCATAAAASAGRRITPPGYYTVQRGDSLWLDFPAALSGGLRAIAESIAPTGRVIRNPNLIHPCQTDIRAAAALLMDISAAVILFQRDANTHPLTTPLAAAGCSRA